MKNAKVKILLFLVAFLVIDSLLKFFFDTGLIDSNLFSVDIKFMLSSLVD